MAHEEEGADKGKECGVKSEEMVDGAQDKEGEVLVEVGLVGVDRC